MSEIRQVRLDLDLKLIEECAKELGYKVRHDSFVYGYSTRDIKCPLVVDVAGNMSIGFDSRRIVYDNWQDICKNAMTKLMIQYINKKLGRKTEVVSDTKNKLLLKVRI